MSTDAELPVYVRSMYGYHTQQPLVTLVVGERMTQMPPAKAREIALLLLECAEAAEHDGFLVRFFRDRAGFDEAQIGQILNEYRKSRKARP
jgi:hypothetical protein